MIPLKFTAADVERANAEWGCNCGPAAIAAVMGLSLAELRPQLGDFERKRYTNPTLMWEVLGWLGRPWTKKLRPKDWPTYGLARIQWEGPWLGPDVPAAAAYRHTHWVGANARNRANIGIFDINAMDSGGWVALADWRDIIVPHILHHAVPRATGGWYLTHAVEIELPR